MVEQRAPWPPAPGWRPLPPPPAGMRHGSGLFPGGPRRPTFREPHRIGAGGLLAGLGAGFLWLTLFGFLGGDLAGYAWWTIAAAAGAWVAAVVLAVFGDRGVAVGVAISAGIGWAVATAFVIARWVSTNDWPLW